jgi:hypothetical protein
MSSNVRGIPIASGAIFPRIVAVVRAIVERKSGEPVSA